jgi:sterol desaturase/sphingolipid hydroxylase (fatty acid hydroxylase superfamily)
MAILTALIKTVSIVVAYSFIYEIFNPEVNGIRTNIMGWESFGYAWYVWIICHVLDDFSYYWFHRQNHMIRFLWAAHVVHHSSENYNLSTALRNGWFTIMYKPLFYMWIPAIGFAPEMAVLCSSIGILWQFQLHTTYIPTLGVFDKILNTHTMHQVHHAKNFEYLDKNHGSFLNVFDKLFGTWKKLDNNIKIEYGVTHAPKSNNPWVLLTHEYKDIWSDTKKSKKWHHKFMYIFGPPGWSHDKSTLTVKEMRSISQKEQINH